MSIRRIEVGPRMSQAVVHGNTVYLAGQVAADTSGDATAQTKVVLDQIDALLATAGTDKSRILSATIYLPDMGDFGAMNVAWEAWASKGNTPARATVESKLAAPAYKVEIAVIAALPD